MMRQILFALWVFLPAGIANAAPVFAARLPILKNWNTPMDFGKTWRGQRLLGAHKTWRGLVVGMVVATLTLWGQQILYSHSVFIQTISLHVIFTELPLLAGPLFGLGALAGDAVKSFFKRRRGVESGKSWFPFDQIDYIIGGLVATAPFLHWGLGQAATVLAVWTAMHLVATYVGYLLKIREAPI